LADIGGARTALNVYAGEGIVGGAGLT